MLWFWFNSKSASEYNTLIELYFPTLLLQSGKLKGMMPAIISIGERLRGKISTAVKENRPIEIKDLTIRFIELSIVLSLEVSNRKWFSTRFALDVVGTVAFGLDVNTLENPDDPFRDLEKLVNNGQIINRIRLVGAFMCPRYDIFIFEWIFHSNWRIHAKHIYLFNFKHTQSSANVIAVHRIQEPHRWVGQNGDGISRNEQCATQWLHTTVDGITENRQNNGRHAERRWKMWKHDGWQQRQHQRVHDNRTMRCTGGSLLFGRFRYERECHCELFIWIITNARFDGTTAMRNRWRFDEIR